MASNACSLGVRERSSEATVSIGTGHGPGLATGSVVGEDWGDTGTPRSRDCLDGSEVGTEGKVADTVSKVDEMVVLAGVELCLVELCLVEMALLGMGSAEAALPGTASAGIDLAEVGGVGEEVATELSTLRCTGSVEDLIGGVGRWGAAAGSAAGPKARGVPGTP